MNLEKRWTVLASIHNLDAVQGWELLARNYCEKGRYWHSFSHIEECLNLLDTTDLPEERKTNLEFALFFHDVIYDTHRSDNEERSAEVASEFLGDFSGKEAVARLILATRHSHTKPEIADEKLIADIDLSILGRPPECYSEYAGAIRKEYQWVPDSKYREGRIGLLRKFLDRHTIFHTVTFQNKFESKARANIASEIERLSQ